jgi:hypothetical protein
MQARTTGSCLTVETHTQLNVCPLSDVCSLGPFSFALVGHRYPYISDWVSKWFKVPMGLSLATSTVPSGCGHCGWADKFLYEAKVSQRYRYPSLPVAESRDSDDPTRRSALRPFSPLPLPLSRFVFSLVFTVFQRSISLATQYITLFKPTYPHLELRIRAPGVPRDIPVCTRRGRADRPTSFHPTSGIRQQSPTPTSGHELDI